MQKKVLKFKPIFVLNSIKFLFRLPEITYSIILNVKFQTLDKAGWPHSSQNEIPCVFPEFSLCGRNFPCVIFTQKLKISSMNKAHIATVLLYTEAYNSVFKVWII